MYNQNENEYFQQIKSNINNKLINLVNRIPLVCFVCAISGWEGIASPNTISYANWLCNVMLCFSVSSLIVHFDRVNYISISFCFFCFVFYRATHTRLSSALTIVHAVRVNGGESERVEHTGARDGWQWRRWSIHAVRQRLPYHIAARL